MTCTQCAATYQVDEGNLFPPIQCPPCHEILVAKMAEEAALANSAGARKRQAIQLAAIQSRIPDTNVPGKFPNPQAWAAVKNWMWNARRQPVLVLYGGSGSCKSRMASQVTIDWLTDNLGRSVDWWQGLELKTAYLKTFADTFDSHTLDGFHRQLTRSPWLVIDDWLHTKASQSLGEFLLAVIDSRIAAHRPTIITMQSDESPTMDKLLATVEHQFESPLTGEAMARRLFQHSTTVFT